jgi:hypothetical protein
MKGRIEDNDRGEERRERGTRSRKQRMEDLDERKWDRGYRTEDSKERSEDQRAVDVGEHLGKRTGRGNREQRGTPGGTSDTREPHKTVQQRTENRV